MAPGTRLRKGSRSSPSPARAATWVRSSSPPSARPGTRSVAWFGSPVPGSGDRFFDLSSAGSSDALDGVDLLVHCAYDMALTNEGRHLAVERLWHRCAVRPGRVQRGLRRTIVLSSMSAYPGTRQLYGRAKLATELAARARGLCVVRPGLVYGAGWGGMAGTLRRLAALPRTSRLRPEGASVHRLRTGFRGCRPRLGPGRARPCPPGRYCASRPGSIQRTSDEPSPPASGSHRPGSSRPLPWWSTEPCVPPELLPVSLPGPSGLPPRARPAPAPNVPHLEVLDQLGVVLQPFALIGAGDGEVEPSPSGSEPG